jgi:hypothetical protein
VVGKRVDEHFITGPHQYGAPFYGEVGAWYGALNFAQLRFTDPVGQALRPIVAGWLRDPIDWPPRACG